MLRFDRIACLLLGFVAFGWFLANVAPADSASPQGEVLSAPQWVGGVDARGKAQLTWIRTPAFATVRVYRRDEAPQAQFRQLGETKENVWLDDTIQPGRTYYYRLTGIGPDGREGRPSAELVRADRRRDPASPRAPGLGRLPGGRGRGRPQVVRTRG